MTVRVKLVCKLLKYFDENELPFIRVHRSYIVNLNFVKSYTKGSGGFLTMTDGTEVEVSASYIKVCLGAWEVFKIEQADSFKRLLSHIWSVSQWSDLRSFPLFVPYCLPRS